MPEGRPGDNPIDEVAHSSGPVVRLEGHDSMTVEFRRAPRIRDYVAVRVVGFDLDVLHDRVYASAEEVSSYFASLAKQWDGFAGVIEWSSIEEDAAFSARHDGWGTVTLDVILTRRRQDGSDAWTTQASIRFDAGWLEAASVGIASWSRD